MSLKSLILLAVAACGDCWEVTETGPGLSGTLAYTTGDGAHVAEELQHGSRLDMASSDSIELAGSFTDSFSRSRSYRLTVHGLYPGTFELAGLGGACLPRQMGGESICSPLEGTIEVRALAADCYSHESGISACAETIDLVLHATSTWESTLLEIDAEMQTVGEWTEAECED